MDYSSLAYAIAFGAFFVLAIITAYREGIRDCERWHKVNCTVPMESIWPDKAPTVVKISEDEEDLVDESPESSYGDVVDSFVAQQQAAGVVFSTAEIEELKNVEDVY